MLIKTQFVGRDLQIDVYNWEEFDAVADTLISAGIKPRYRPLSPDPAKREGRRYVAPANKVNDLENILGGLFQPSGGFVPALAVGNNYACREISIGGRGRGCEDLKASNKSNAKFKCGLIARQKNWFGGAARKGYC